MHHAVSAKPVAATLAGALLKVPSFAARSRVSPVTGSVCSVKYNTARRCTSSSSADSSGRRAYARSRITGNGAVLIAACAAVSPACAIGAAASPAIISPAAVPRKIRRGSPWLSA
ncbi:MAG: hypothetical protein NTV51_07855 [Verrucomicrobia bacterium]|nr:hypothetical protein [Verrucomicrobiota bacterium]